MHIRLDEMLVGALVDIPQGGHLVLAAVGGGHSLPLGTRREESPETRINPARASGLIGEPSSRYTVSIR